MTVLRDTQIVVETIATADPKLRVSQVLIETLAVADPKLRLSQVTIETLCDNVADDVPSTGSYRFFFNG